MRALADADAFRSLNLDRRAALWEVRRLPEDDPLPLFTKAAVPELGIEADANLPLMSLGQHVATDYQTMRLSLKAHPMALLRPMFSEEGVCSAIETAKRANGRFTRMAGLVLVRQRPGKGNAIFITLEDETGITNCVLWARQFEALRRPVMAARLMLVEGRVQTSVEGVVHLIVSHSVDRSSALDLLWEKQGGGAAFAKTLLSPADEGATLGSPGTMRDPRYWPPDHGPPDPQTAPMRHRHPRDARILPKSRDFH
jgi:error-prone DNA polymerase